MKAQAMTQYGIGKGNCLDACIASLLEISIESVPNLSDSDKEWHEKTRDFLRDAGFSCLWVHEQGLSQVIITNALCIAILKTDTAELHAKVGRWKSWKNYEGTYAYIVEEEFDPNEHKTYECGELVGVLLIFRSL